MHMRVSHADVAASALSAAADSAIAFVNTTVNKASSTAADTAAAAAAATAAATTSATASKAPLERDEAEFGALGVVASPPLELGLAGGGGSLNGNDGAGRSSQS
jgi:hypothetical protein